MNTVLIIPTGIGAEIGGHAGDANVVAKLLASVSDILITHPNVVNGSDINEMTENTLYVEGSMLDRFLDSKICLENVKSNKILVVVNEPLRNETVNAISASRVTLGIDVEIVELNTPLKLIATIDNNIASGRVEGWKELVAQVSKYDFDVLAIASKITISEEIAKHYLNNGGVNPYGGVEAKASKLITSALNKPVAHAPMDTEDNEWIKTFNPIVDPRIAPEMVSVCYIQSVLKGLHKAPRIGKGLNVDEIDVLVSPDNCWGTPHRLCKQQNIPIIVVKENKTVANSPMDKDCIFVENYLEASGVITAMKEGIALDTLRRPIKYTKIIKEKRNGQI